MCDFKLVSNGLTTHRIEQHQQLFIKMENDTAKYVNHIIQRNFVNLTVDWVRESRLLCVKLALWLSKQIISSRFNSQVMRRGYCRERNIAKELHANSWKLFNIHFLIFKPCTFCSMLINNQREHWLLAVYYFIQSLLHVSTHVSSSESSSVPAELSVNRIQWLIRLCLIRCYVSVMWSPGVHRSVCLRCWEPTHTFWRI
jgi:hypothetical protein